LFHVIIKERSQKFELAIK